MLEFDVNGQTLKRTDKFSPATDSVDYLKAKFSFKGTDWNGTAKTALFRLGESVYNKLLDSSGACKVPSEVLVRADSRYARHHGSNFSVSLIGEKNTTRITTNEIAIKLNTSVYGELEAPADPTDTMYQQILTAYAENEAAIQEAQAECEDARSDLVGVKNIFANAITGKLSSSVVFADDVSPVEHNPVVKVHGKNLFSTAEKLIELDAAYGGLPLAFKGEAGKTYTVSANYEQTGTQTRIGISINTYQGKWIKETYRDAKSGNITISFEYPEMHDTESYVTIGFFSNITASSVPGAKCQYTNIQVEEGDAATAYTPWIDPTTILVSRYGRNVLNLANSSPSNCTVEGTGLKANINNVYYMEVYSDYLKMAVQNSDGKYMTLSVGNIAANSYIALIVMYTDGTYLQMSSATKSVTLLLNHEGRAVQHIIVRPLAKSSPFTDTTTVIRDIMVEFSEVKGDFEPYNGKGYTPSTDGTVTGITSLSPGMTILTDTDGVTVECEYIRDSNKVIAKLVNAITALGGTV